MQDHAAVAGDDECRCAWGQWVGEIAGQFTRAVVTETARREMAAKWRRFSQAARSPQRRRRLLDAVQQQFRFESSAIGKSRERISAQELR